MNASYIWAHCPTCQTATVQHRDPGASSEIHQTYYCQECGGIRSPKPSDLIRGGMRRQDGPTGSLLNRIQKQIQKNQGEEQ
jgi:hypothetical protein